MWNRLLGGGRSQPEPVRAGLFGKVPALPDFVQFGPVSDGVRELRDWLDAAVSWGSLRRPEAQEAFRAEQGRIYAFVFRPRTSGRELVAGVLKPSRDAVGRSFPLSVYASLPSEPVERHPELLPLVLGDFLEQTLQVAFAPDPLATIGGLDALVARGELDVLGALGAHERDYAGWADSTPLGNVVSALCGPGGAPAALGAVATIREAIAPFHGQERPSTRVSVRLPLGSGGVGAAAFWLDVVRRSSGVRSTVPSAFWSADALGGDVLVQLGDTPESSLAELWAPDASSEHTCNLTLPNGIATDSFLSRLPPAIHHVFQRPDARVADLLDALTA